MNNGSSVKYPGLQEWVIKRLKAGKTPPSLYETAVKRYGYESSKDQFCKYCNTVKTRHVVKLPRKEPTTNPQEMVGDDVSIVLKKLKKEKEVDVVELCNQLNCPPRRINEIVEHLRSKGSEISVTNGTVFLNTDIVADVDGVDRISETEIVFGVASDLHFGSKSCQITALNEFAEICRKKGVQHIFCPGDVVAGYNVYPGQQFDLYGLSAEEQESSTVRNLPQGFTWYMLGGNHDYAFIKKGGGHNPLLSISSQREDVQYVGFDEANIPILHGVEMKLWHPSGGVPYSISYRLQKGVEQVAYHELTRIVRGATDRPTIRFILSGHLHIQMQALFGSIFGCQCGTFEGQTNYLKRKGLTPNIGGYIVQASLGQNGLLKNFDAKFYVFEEIEDDWRQYNHSVEQQKIERPVFAA